MNSKTTSDDEAFVWIWLPGAIEPVVAGRISKDGDQYLFNYGQSYLALENAISLNARELPLQPGFILPLPELTIAGCLRDGSPDAWGRRVILNRLSNSTIHKGEINDTDELLFMLLSGSNRMGAIDFQGSSSVYEPRVHDNTKLEELIVSIERVENGEPLTPALDHALMHGTSIGGARPKAHIIDHKKQYIAKFSSQSDTRSVVKSEYVAMRLAAAVGLNVAPVRIVKVANKDVLLVERFDRIHTPAGWQRKPMVSALTLFELDEMMARYASYEELAEIIRLDFSDPKKTLRELYARLVFNILVGNTDDHARNHAAFWDGTQFTLTPAYDICPQNRTGREASQAMRIAGERNLSRLDICVESAAIFGLSTEEATQIIEHQINIIKNQWESVCDECDLHDTDRKLLWRQQIFNPFSVEGFEHHV